MYSMFYLNPNASGKSYDKLRAKARTLLVRATTKCKIQHEHFGLRATTKCKIQHEHFGLRAMARCKIQHEHFGLRAMTNCKI